MCGSITAKASSFSNIGRNVARVIILITSLWISFLILGQQTPPFLTHNAYTDERVRFQNVRLAKTREFDYHPPSSPSSMQALNHTLTKSIFIGAILHNNAEYLHTTLKLVDSIGMMFNSYHVGFYENDSTDGTAEILAQWKEHHQNANNIHVVSEVLKVRGAVSFGGVNKQRFDLMAKYRNKYLTMLEKYAPDVDYVMVIDMDIFDTTLDAFLSSFTPEALAKNWTAVGANGVYNGKRYYDSLAFRNAEFPDTRIGRTRKYAQAVYPRDSTWVPVDSMFGGMVVYRAECMRGCKYLQDGDCEHVSLYKCMSQKGEDCRRFFINPAFLVDYQVFL